MEKVKYKFLFRCPGEEPVMVIHDTRPGDAEACARKMAKIVAKREEVTGMAEREKVIRGLELCAYDPDPGQELKEIRSCPECPYYRAGCSPQLIRDAIALLREQEPRVLTLQELQAIETPWNRNTPPYLWIEGRSATTESRWMSWGFMHDCVIFPGTMGVQNYGSKWRVWNLQPTPEQMRDTPWEGEEDAE